MSCDYCDDLRFITPAKYIGTGNVMEPEWLTEAKKNKNFLEIVYEDNELYTFNIVTECPVCGKKLTEDLYDEY